MNRWVVPVSVVAILAVVGLVFLLRGPVAAALRSRAERKERDRVRREAFERSKDLVGLLLQDPFLAREVHARLSEELKSSREAFEAEIETGRR